MALFRGKQYQPAKSMREKLFGQRDTSEKYRDKPYKVSGKGFMYDVPNKEAAERYKSELEKRGTKAKIRRAFV